jgi:rhodanese-related sulfurtransferase
MKALAIDRKQLLGMGFAFTVLLLALSTDNEGPNPVVPQIRAAEVFALIKAGATIVIDVREKQAYDEGHIPGAISLPIGQIDDEIDGINVKTADEIVIYCNEGSKRGPKATKKFNDAGYPNVKNLKGGLEGWEKADYDIVSK